MRLIFENACFTMSEGGRFYASYRRIKLLQKKTPINKMRKLRQGARLPRDRDSRLQSDCSCRVLCGASQKRHVTRYRAHRHIALSRISSAGPRHMLGSQEDPEMILSPVA